MRKVAMDTTGNLNRPVPVFDPGKGLLHNDHFQVAYVTNDIDRAVGIFRERFGVAAFRENDNELANGAKVGVRSVWIGNMMYEICFGSGPGMELYTDHAPPGGEFVLAFHHFGYLVPSDAAWDVLERQIEAGGWQMRSRSDLPGFFRGCYIAVPELGHYLEFVQPRAGLLERMNATPVA
jgi:hypothetical protein